MKSIPLKVAVFGANGATGQRIVEAILSRGHVVVAAVRRPETIAPRKGVTVAQIDFNNPASLTTAIIGCDAVISAVGSRSSSSKYSSQQQSSQDGGAGGAGNQYQSRSPTVYSTSVRALREAMRKCGVCRLIVLSCDGVEEDFEGPRVISNLRRRIGMNRFLDIVRMETVLEETHDIDWTVVRLTSLVDVKRRPYLVENRVLDRGSSKISYLDAADFVVKEMEENKWIRMFPVIGYPWSAF